MERPEKISTGSVTVTWNVVWENMGSVFAVDWLTGTNVLRNVLQKMYACYYAWLLVNISIVSLLLATAEKKYLHFLVNLACETLTFVNTRGSTITRSLLNQNFVVRLEGVQFRQEHCSFVLFGKFMR